MEHLNWKSKAIRVSQIAIGTKMALTLDCTGLEIADREALKQALGRVLAPDANPLEELKLELPEQSGNRWTLYFKTKPTSRLQLAKPALNEWVGSLHLSPQHGQKLVETLGSPEIAVSKLGTANTLSNLEVIIKS